ncbi:MAG: Sec-independent protein translocase protein TatB [Xanthobacteraceae bacterium]|jgi:sec-independent protein translocase protein TatB
MFDISWTEFLLIGIVALIVIGPKELPAVMRTMGQWTRKIRGMAADFQNQFQEAMREAEMTDLKKEVDDLAHGVTHGFTNIDPLKSVREDVETMGKDIEKSLAGGTDPKPAETGPAEPTPAAVAGAEPVPAVAAPEPMLELPPAATPESLPAPDQAAAAAAPGNPEHTG